MLSMERECLVLLGISSPSQCSDSLGTLRGMINAAERSLAALAERDNLEDLRRKQHPPTQPANAGVDDLDTAQVRGEAINFPNHVCMRAPPSPEHPCTHEAPP